MNTLFVAFFLSLISCSSMYLSAQGDEIITFHDSVLEHITSPDEVKKILEVHKHLLNAKDKLGRTLTVRTLQECILLHSDPVTVQYANNFYIPLFKAIFAYPDLDPTIAGQWASAAYDNQAMNTYELINFLKLTNIQIGHYLIDRFYEYCLTCKKLMKITDMTQLHEVKCKFPIVHRMCKPCKEAFMKTNPTKCAADEITELYHAITTYMNDTAKLRELLQQKRNLLSVPDQSQRTIVHRFIDKFFVDMQIAETCLCMEQGYTPAFKELFEHCDDSFITTELYDRINKLKSEELKEVFKNKMVRECNVCFGTFRAIDMERITELKCKADQHKICKDCKKDYLNQTTRTPTGASVKRYSTCPVGCHD